MSTIETSCRCGAVHLTIQGEPAVQLYCHCDDCRAAHDAAYVDASIYPAAAVQASGGALAEHAVRRTPRLSCAACGTHLFSEVASVGLRSVNAWLLPEGAFQPQFHVQCQHAVLPVVDELPHFKGFPPAFGGSDERVGW